jgi:plastocyanin
MSSSSLDGRRSAIAMVAVVLLATVAIAGCGSSSSGSTSTSSSTPATTSSSTATTSSTSTSATAPSGASEALKLEANKEGQLAYSTKSLSAKSGNVSIDFTNEAPIGHNLTIESSAGKTVGSTPTFQGGSKTLSLHLAPGTYKFFCSVPGHRMAGMEGTLVVK